jgi:hypothetical protein
MVPQSLIGWFITPVGILLTLLVLFKKINGDSLKYYFLIGLIWTIIAIVLDYVFIVMLLKPADGYYKLDVYFYYITTLVLPLVVCFLKKKK